MLNFFVGYIYFCTFIRGASVNKLLIKKINALKKQSVSKTCRWCASMRGNGPVSSVRAELQQMVVESVLWRVSTNQQHRGVSAHS